MTAAMIAVDALVPALGEAEPCGPELDHHEEFLALERAAAGTPERQYGDKVFPAEPPDWQRVFELAGLLAGRARDVRLAVWLLRSGARMHGFAVAVQGLQLIAALLETHWDCVHPQLDASDANDPTMRINALLPLAATDAVLADLRASALAPVRGSMTLRQLELGLGRDDPHGDEASPSEAGVLQGLEALLGQHAELAEQLEAGWGAADRISRLLDERVGVLAPNLGPLLQLLAVGRDAVRRLGRADAESMGPDAPEVAAAPSLPVSRAPSGAVNSREDVLRELDRLCVWLEFHEPSHPAPLLLRRAQRLMRMSFIEIIRDMASNGLDQVQTIAGPESDPNT